MATLSPTNPTLTDHLKRLDPDGNIAAIGELLSETNEILADATVVEGNLPTGHRTTVRTDLPSVTWRKLNYGVQPSKSKTKQVDDTCGMLEAYAEVDKDLADLNGNSKAFRLSEDRAFLEAMNQEMASTMFYGDTATDPEKYLGLAPRYDAATDTNVIDYGDTGSNCTSIWFVCWSPLTAHLTFPKGSIAGLRSEDKGQVTLQDAAGGNYEGYRTHYQWKLGLVIRDWRYVVRIASIDTADFSGDDFADVMIDAWHKIPNPNMGRTVIYCNKTMQAAFAKKAKDKSNMALGLGEWAGRPIPTFWGHPIHRCDAILNTEDAL